MGRQSAESYTDQAFCKYVVLSVRSQPIIHRSMGAVNLVVMVESVRDLVERTADSDTNTFHLPSIVAVGAALGKFQCLQ